MLPINLNSAEDELLRQLFDISSMLNKFSVNPEKMKPLERIASEAFERKIRKGITNEEIYYSNNS